MGLIELVRPAPLPIEIEPRPCERCGRTIDQHDCRDDGDGPLFFCWSDGDIVTLWELADPRDAWRQTGEAPPAWTVRNSDIAGSTPERPQLYRTAQSTVEAFRFVVAAGDIQHVKGWLGDHPKDAPYLISILERQNHAA
ncbi:hypothetical protein [Bradyrhizobium sp. LTSPM299]|uniref:hypothetical protein n=1 Tax=Bradyrhizobium sp. LTSPM299 TaxID=1619233 RepID=UPI000678D0FD|nr:hypothetical protein [Bradyrhizobium sp. LTSPM299]